MNTQQCFFISHPHDDLNDPSWCQIREGVELQHDIPLSVKPVTFKLMFDVIIKLVLYSNAKPGQSSNNRTRLSSPRSMASLYGDPEWSSQLDAAVSRLSGSGVTLEEALTWLDGRAKDSDFSLSDIWGVLISAGVMKQVAEPLNAERCFKCCMRGTLCLCLSDGREVSVRGGRQERHQPVPHLLRHREVLLLKWAYSRYPGPHAAGSQLVIRINRLWVCSGKWFEVSPHEAGFTEMGLFVPTPLLSSRFEEGALLEEKPEMDMVRLQGEQPGTEPCEAVVQRRFQSNKK